MSKLVRRASILLVVLLAVTGLVACGSTRTNSTTSGNTASSNAANSSTAGGSGEVVARVGEAPITKAALNQWMTALAGQDYYSLSGKHTVPEGLVSDPPNYASCVSHVEAAVGHPKSGQFVPSAAQLLDKCRELNQAVKIQALSFLVRAQWTIALDRELGLTVSDAEVAKGVARVKAQYPTAAAFEEYLASHRWTLANQTLETELSLLGEKFLHQVEAGGKTEYAKFIAAGQRWSMKTECNPGYVVMYCAQYKAGTKLYPGKPPAVLMEQVASIIIDRCTDRGACG
jgi:hypothetical protein